ncbi:MAG: CHAP domain-containing protein [Patescibacteria group bacterium]
MKLIFLKKYKAAVLVGPLIFSSILILGGTIVAAAVGGAGFMNIMKAQGDPAASNYSSGDVSCNTWAKVGISEQTLMTQAAKEAGIHPAMLAAIYWKENGRQWKPMGSDFACVVNGCGPFQLDSASREAYGLSKEDAKDFAKSVGPAAKIIKNKAESLGITNFSDVHAIQAVALAYNRGANVAKLWVADGYPMSADKIKEYQDQSNYGSKIYPLWSKQGITAIRGAQIALDYLQDVGKTFTELAEGCTINGQLTVGNQTGNEIVKLATDELAAGKKGYKTGGANCVKYVPGKGCAQWCTYFVSWILAQVYNDPEVAKIGRTLNLRDYFIKNHTWFKPKSLSEIQAGDVFMVPSRASDSGYHVGFVVTPVDLVTIEGNVGDDEIRIQHHRTLKDLQCANCGIGRW